MTKEQQVNASTLEQNAAQKWNELQISNDFIFNKLMQNPKICKRVLEIVLEVKIDRIEYPQTEKSMKMTKDGKGIRLDVYVADDKHSVYNVFCNPFLEKIAKHFWRMLQSAFGENCISILENVADLTDMSFSQVF